MDILYPLSMRVAKATLAGTDEVDLDPFTGRRHRRVAVISEPFPHLVVDDFFTAEAYRTLCAGFDTAMRQGFSETIGGRRFHRFEVDYDGYVHTLVPSAEASNPFALFFSLEWNRFFSRIFGVTTGFETTAALHHHPSGDRTGYVHNDDADKPFSRKGRLANGVIWSAAGPDARPCRRKLALLYFLENDGWREGDGGETALYAADAKTLVKKVAPINNRLLAFRIGPNSMHAFQENRAERNAVVQWFHCPPEYA